MKKLSIVLILFILSMTIVSVHGQMQVPDESNTKLLQQINQEHSNTRKYFSDELSRQQKIFYNQMDDRANYYEAELNNMIATAVWKLSLLWGGVVFFLVSFNNLIRNRLEKKRFKKLKESLKKEVLRDFALQQQGKYKEQVQKPVMQTKQGYQVETDELFKHENKIPPKQPEPTPKKKKWWQKKKKEKQPVALTEVEYNNTFEVEY